MNKMREYLLKPIENPTKESWKILEKNASEKEHIYHNKIGGKPISMEYLKYHLAWLVQANISCEFSPVYDFITFFLFLLINVL